MNVSNFDKSTDPFAEEQELNAGTEDVGSQQDYIHLRVQQRTGRKAWTFVENVPKGMDKTKLLAVLKKKFACNGILTDEGKAIQLQGDHRISIQDFLTDQCGINKKTIKLHGY